MYNAYVVEINKLRKHSNADRLQVATFFGNDVIVGLDVKLGDKGVYFPTDGQLSEEFASKNNLLRKKDENGNNVGGYLDPLKRNITAIKLRGEKSDGLYVPIHVFKSFCDIDTLTVGSMFSTLNGKLICEKYIPVKKQQIVRSQHNKTKKKEGDLCYITLKLHGTSQRTSNTLKNNNNRFISKILKKLKLQKNNWEYVSGTRNVVINDFDSGYYGDNKFRETHHNYFKGKLHKGETVYYEVVGYYDNDKTIMPECDNKKTKDKDFIKKYGKTTKFTYGCDKGQNDIYVYRMTMHNEDGHVVEYPTELVMARCEQMGIKFAPVLDKFIMTTREDLIKRVNELEYGVDPIGKTHIREGVVIRIDNRDTFKAFKQKNFHFKVLEGIIKSDGILDIEEEASIQE